MSEGATIDVYLMCGYFYPNVRLYGVHGEYIFIEDKNGIKSCISIDDIAGVGMTYTG